MRPRPASSLTATVYTLLLLSAMILTGCKQENLPAPSPAEQALTIAYDLQLTDPVSELLGHWKEEHSTPLVVISDASSAITLSAQSDHTPPDVLILTVQMPLPTGDRAPISVRPWLTDPLVFFTRTDEPRLPSEILIDPDTRLAISIEAGPMGQYTRFGLRKIRRWELVKGRVLRHSIHTAILDAVRHNDATMGVVYATMLSEDHNGLSMRTELYVSDTALRAFVVVAQTPAGVDLARWLTEPAQLVHVAPFGYRPTTPLKTQPTSPEED